MQQLLLTYIFVCFSVGLVCMGVTLVVAHCTRSPVARAFLAFYAALTLLVLASLLLAFLDIVPSSVAPATRSILEYFEAIVGCYGVVFTLPFLAHRVFAVRARGRDRILLGTVGLALVVQHVTEYGLGGSWDDRGDLLENLFFGAVLVYTLALGCRRLDRPGVDRLLARRFLLLVALGVPVVLHDLFLIEVTGLRFYPLAYSALSVVYVWTLSGRAGSAAGSPVPPEWDLSEREAEVTLLLSRGLSNKEIAAALFISVNTVKTHVRAVFKKSGRRSRFALISAIGSERPDYQGPLL